MEKAIFSEWKHSTDEDQRDAMWMLIQLLPRFEAILTAAINNGAVANKELNNLNPNNSRFNKY